MGKLVMGYWDCPYCDKKEIRGDTAVCPACGRPRGQVKFYMKGQAQNQERRADDVADIEYVDEERAKYVNRNPDWYCSFCETLNSDNAETCRSCGASRADSEANYFQMREKVEAREAAGRKERSWMKTGGASAPIGERRNTPSGSAGAWAWPPEDGFTWWRRIWKAIP